MLDSYKTNKQFFELFSMLNLLKKSSPQLYNNIVDPGFDKDDDQAHLKDFQERLQQIQVTRCEHFKIKNKKVTPLEERETIPPLNLKLGDLLKKAEEGEGFIFSLKVFTCEEPREIE